MEYEETKDIPKHIKNKDYKKEEEVGDIGKMTFLFSLWVLSDEGVLSGILVKYFKKMRPSALKNKRHSFVINSFRFSTVQIPLISHYKALNIVHS